jgi:hypothetical protein
MKTIKIHIRDHKYGEDLEVLDLDTNIYRFDKKLIRYYHYGKKKFLNKKVLCKSVISKFLTDNNIYHEYYIHDTNTYNRDGILHEYPYIIVIKKDQVDDRELPNIVDNSNINNSSYQKYQQLFSIFDILK